ncbi:MAG: LysR family transcriptional regulator [Pseudomonadota bacterium]
MLPSLPALRAFDAAARRGSFRAAAEHLSVTATAISHHVRGLEEQLGVKLFERTGRDIVLTEEGRRLAETTARAFSMLEDAVQTVRRTARRVVRLAAGPIFTARWLMPRIGDFWRAHPGVQLEVAPSFRPRAHTEGDADIVVTWERVSDMPEGAVKLLELRPVAIASEQFLDRNGPIETPADLLRAPLIHQRNQLGWLDWFAAMGVRLEEDLRGPVFEDANAILRGAAGGQGAVIGWLPLIQQDLNEGRVVRLFNEEIAPTHGYFLEIASDRRAETIAVVNWLTAQRADNA